MTADRRAWVGPVLAVGPLTDVLVQVLREQNREITVVDRGSYVRVLSPGVCEMDVRAVEERLGAPLRLPGDLERVMPSFQGALSFSGSVVAWRPQKRAG